MPRAAPGPPPGLLTTYDVLRRVEPSRRFNERLGREGVDEVVFR